jgi:hypothetical protein
MIHEEAIKIKKDLLMFTIGSSNFFDITAGKYLDNIFKYQCGVVESYKLLSLDVAKKYLGWSPNFVQRFSQDVLLCALRAFVCQPKRKDKEVVKGMDQAVIMKLKSDLHLHHCYVQDLFTSEQICKLTDIATAGDNLITVINLCATYDGHSCAFGGYSPPEKSNHESASAKVMRMIDEVGFDDSTFLFNNSRLFNCNVRPVAY